MIPTKGKCFLVLLDEVKIFVDAYIPGIFRYETISDLMSLQDRIDQFQKRVFAHFRPSSNNECRIAALVPLVEEVMVSISSSPVCCAQCIDVSILCLVGMYTVV
jgi:hypothetical protein